MPQKQRIIGSNESASLQSRSSQQHHHGRSLLPVQSWPQRISTNVMTWLAMRSPSGTKQYSLLSDAGDMDIYNHKPVHAWLKPAFRFPNRLRVRRCVWTAFITLPSLVMLVIILIATLYPSYSHPPHHYHVLRGQALGSTRPGRANPNNEKIFIASSIYDSQGQLASGAWGKSVLALVDLLGNDNVFLSLFEDDPDALATTSLRHFSEQVKCNSSIVAEHIDRATLPHIRLPSGEERLKRIEFLAHVRNRALAPLADPTSSAYSVRFDKLLYINDVVFDPVDAVQLMFSTNIDSNGKAQYHAACAADFINPFKYYDTFATRDYEGNRMGVPVYPWFSGLGKAESRKDVLDQTDAVRVRSCWGGMVVFNARWFQPDHVNIGIADLTVDHNATLASAFPASSAIDDTGSSRGPYDPTSTPTTRRSSLRQAALRFRASTDTFWDASECCLIHADIEAASDRTSLSATGIYLNPYIRVAYSSRTLAFLRISRRFERIFTPFHKLIGSGLGLPTDNPRRTQEVGQNYEDVVWEYDDLEWMHTGNMSGRYKNVTRAALPGGFCGSRKLLVLGKGHDMRQWSNEAVRIPTR